MALRALDDLARSGDSPTAAAFPGGPLEALLPRLETLHRSLAKSAKRFTALSDAEQHRARKRLKRLRYLTEFVAPLFRRRLVRPYLTRLETAQLALGRLNDCTIALEAYLGLIQDEPGKWFAIGWLRSRRDALAQQAMDALVALRGAPRFW
jgi:CHAD domain-containing protein